MVRIYHPPDFLDGGILVTLGGGGGGLSSQSGISDLYVNCESKDMWIRIYLLYVAFTLPI